MNKRGSHVGVMISFSMFVAMMIFIFIVSWPALKPEENKENTLNHLEEEIIEETSATLIGATIMVNATDNFCIKIVGGINEDGSFGFYSVSPDGTIIPIEKFESDGSGSTFVVGLLERMYKKNLTVEEGVELAKESLKSSTQRDLYSGLGIDIFTITKDGIKKVVEQTIEPDYKDDKKE